MKTSAIARTGVLEHVEMGDPVRIRLREPRRPLTRGPMGSLMRLGRMVNGDLCLREDSIERLGDTLWFSIIADLDEELPRWWSCQFCKHEWREPPLPGGCPKCWRQA